MPLLAIRNSYAGRTDLSLIEKFSPHCYYSLPSCGVRSWKMLSNWVVMVFTQAKSWTRSFLPRTLSDRLLRNSRRWWWWWAKDTSPSNWRDATVFVKRVLSSSSTLSSSLFITAIYAQQRRFILPLFHDCWRINYHLWSHSLTFSFINTEFSLASALCRVRVRLSRPWIHSRRVPGTCRRRHFVNGELEGSQSSLIRTDCWI